MVNEYFMELDAGSLQSRKLSGIALATVIKQDAFCKLEGDLTSQFFICPQKDVS